MEQIKIKFANRNIEKKLIIRTVVDINYFVKNILSIFDIELLKFTNQSLLNIAQKLYKNFYLFQD